MPPPLSAGQWWSHWIEFGLIDAMVISLVEVTSGDVPAAGVSFSSGEGGRKLGANPAVTDLNAGSNMQTA
ncbi:hypothetical protein [Rhodococcus sp. H29-C3]|uniref:hypothetical protein n=1 Tax=Rhodococcus sp. H29-C3 TaxID=3046307 RepID=UPI0024BA600F|nr:hypothetical protein [Rhodococcus sp. H29-C3]MDJ0362233.1 hypothetical protein [Rhodococcus sp. H29-C3]